jgi:hypothetical protein
MRITIWQHMSMRISLDWSLVKMPRNSLTTRFRTPKPESCIVSPAVSQNSP